MARLRDAARMFAAVDMSIADAGISVWYAKCRYGDWRPSTAINLADTDGDSGPALRREVVNARRWLGIHVRFANTAARGMGVGLADWTSTTSSRPPRPRLGGIVLAA